MTPAISDMFLPVLAGVASIDDGIKNTFLHAKNYLRTNKELRKKIELLEDKISHIEQEVITLREDAFKWRVFKQEINLFQNAEPLALKGEVVMVDLSSYNHFVIVATQNKEIKKGFVVVTPQGLVGTVDNKVGSYAKVKLLTSSHFSATVVVKEIGRHGVVKGVGKNLLKLEYIPDYVSISEGMHLFTSGIDGLFTAGIPVGEIVEIEKKPGEIFLSITVRPFIDFLKLRIVYLLEPPIDIEALGM